jgi:hypothetical protein
LSSQERKKKTTNIQTNSHKLHHEMKHWTRPKIPWHERICKICETNIVEDENIFSWNAQPTRTLDLIFKAL